MRLAATTTTMTVAKMTFLGLLIMAVVCTSNVEAIIHDWCGRFQISFVVE
jgi:hypothetical protein